MSNSAYLAPARHGDAESFRPRSDADLARIAQLLKVFAVSISVLVLGAVAASQLDLPPLFDIPIVLSAAVLMVTTMWLAIKVYALLGVLVVFILLLVSSLLTAFPPLAPFALLGALFMLLSVRDRAATILRTNTARTNSSGVGFGLKADSDHRAAVRARFAWERWLVCAVIAVLVGVVSYSACQSILDASP